MIRLELPAAPSTNSLYATAVAKDGTTHRYLVEAARLWKLDAIARVRVGLRMHYGREATPPLTGVYAVRIEHHWKPSKRRRDIDNCKIVLDALAIGLGCDDSQFRRITIERVDLAPGETEHVVVTVEALEITTPWRHGELHRQDCRRHLAADGRA